MYWDFVFSMLCFVAAAVMTIDIMKSGGEILYVPQGGAGQLTYTAASIASNVGALAMPVYGFFVLEWWEVLTGVLLAVVVCGLVCRRAITGSTYIWVIVLAVVGGGFAYDLYETSNGPKAQRERCLKKASEMPTQAGVHIQLRLCNEKHGYGR